MDRFACVQKELDRLLQMHPRVIVAIDGNCTSGKTTLTRQLAQQYDCNVFHMDDFFLRPEQRTPERYGETGGNVDYVRFREEVLRPLLSGGEFAFRPFSCSTFTLSEPVSVRPRQLNIIEGTYSLHPYFGEVYDLKIRLTVDPELQRQRILERPEFLQKRFFEEWIPMEDRYFQEFSISEKCDLVL